jgi:hypothetical protein
MEKVRVAPSFQLGLGACLCVEKMGYVSVGHLLHWILPKHMAFKKIVYSLFKFLITGSTNDGTLLDWKALGRCWNLWVCVLIKWGMSLLVICFLWISPKYVAVKNVVYSL